MGEVLMPGGGGGADLSQVNATEADVLYPEVFLDSEGNQRTGSIPTRNAANINTSSEDVVIPAGAYIGGTQTIKRVVVTGVDASKMLNTMTLKVGDVGDDDRILNRQGSIPVVTPGTIYPSVNDVNYAAGNYISGNITQKKVQTSNVAAAYFKHQTAVKIGDAGNSERLVRFSGSFDSDGTVTSGVHMRKNKIGYAKGSRYVGTLYPLSASNPTVTKALAANSVTLTCKAPTRQVGMPWSGVRVYGKKGSYPTSISDSDAFSVGILTTSTAGGTCTKTFTNATLMPDKSTIYFRGWNFYLYNTDGSTAYNNNIYGDPIDFGSVYMNPTGYQAYTSGSGSFTVPTGCNKIQIFLCGGGGGCAGCSAGDEWTYSGGAGGGYTTMTSVIAVTGGTTRVTYAVGAGGTGNANGSATTATVGGTTYTAAGGNKSNQNVNSGARGANGGSGGGGSSGTGSGQKGGNGGTNGGNGSAGSSGGAGGTGQGSTTKPWSGYSANAFGAGGGGSSLVNSAATGGSYGGGNGAYNIQASKVNGTSGTAGYGGGAGGTGIGSSGSHVALNGGSGRVVIYYYYSA